MKKVLIIEDNKSFSTMLCSLLLEHYEYQSIVTSTLADAKKALDEYSEDLFVAIADLHLPDALNGESVDLVKAYDVPVLVFTGKFSEAVREDMIFKGVADYTLKDGEHNISHVLKMVDRIHKNYTTKILVIDDSESSRVVMKAMLETQKYQVTLAKSAEEALSILSEKDHNIKVVVTDCHMEGMGGFELTKKIRGSFLSDEIAIIGVSAHGSKALTAKFIKYGADDFILKPFEQEEFLCRINHVMENMDLNENLLILNEQKNDLLGMAAHDVRGPLGIIINSIQLVTKRSQKKGSDDNSELYRMIESNADRLLRLVEDILCSSAIEKGKFSISIENGSLNDLIGEAIEYHRYFFEQKNQVVKLSIDGAIEFGFDKERIRQCVDNLISNGIKYSPVESTIMIDCREVDGCVLLSVSDEGKGISEAFQKNLFKPYSTLGSIATAGESSVGLGLFICDNIATAHHGRLDYSRTKTGGSCFSLSLPLGNA